MANVTYTVVRGDNLTKIANRYNTTVSELVRLNNIKNPDLIITGQVLIISGTAAAADKTNTTSRPTIKLFGHQSDSDSTLYATWTWDKSNTENYEILWTYDTGDGVWFIGSDSTTEDKQSTYNYPANAKKVRFKVKPVSKKKTVNNKETTYWTAGWSEEKTYNVSDAPPGEPSTPTVTIEKYKLTARLDNLDDLNASGIQYQIVKNDSTVFKTGNASIVTGSATYSCSVDAGQEYKVRARSYRGSMYSDWSQYSSNASTMPATPAGFTTIRANSETSVYLEWAAVAAAEAYEIEYTTKAEYFDISDQTTTISSIETLQYEKTGLETGEEYFFRIRAVNDGGSSAWSAIKSVVIGEAPAAPTTWSSTTTAITGESLILYWVHNAEDGSSQTYADLELYIGGQKETHTIRNTEDEDEKDKTSFYTIDTTPYVEGTKIQWRVRTAGVTNEYGDWSIQRTVDIYAPATLELGMTDAAGDDVATLTSFPFYISGLAGPSTQIPTGYHLTITANESYETVDQIGNRMMVSAGDQVYSRYFDIVDSLLVELSAGSVDLENNIPYTVTCTVSMNSGLTAESTHTFTVAWTDMEYEPNAEIGIDMETFTASIRPYCQDEDGELIQNVTLSVYRREYDGSFTEIATDIDNSSGTFVTDPHPSLDYARYRIVALTNDTGAVSYCDLPGYPIDGICAIIQWDEEWSAFDVTREDAMVEPVWSGSMLKLPYNIDVSESTDPDVTLVEYIGRKHPVTYYGTQIGESTSWSMVIPKSDIETLYGLRRLSKWMGDVYVREPSGVGYWANVKVSFSQKHLDLTIPITLDITRVEGGM